MDEAIAGTLAARIVQAAAMLGAPYSSLDELRRAAEHAVDEVQARVAAVNQSGGLQHINRAYRQYRLAAIARAERAISYSSFLERRVATIVAQVAITGKMI